MEINLVKLETETQNTSSSNIDTMNTIEILKVINEADSTVHVAVGKQLNAIAEVVEIAIETLKHQGHVYYIGAGTSGRLGFMDAAECPPTYGVDYEAVQGIMCGGFEALYKAQEGVEDDEELAVTDCKKYHLSNADFLIGIAASGRTPYVISALKYANEIGCKTASIACTSNSEIGKVANVKIEVVTGPEVITGSTRMKAATAQKMILNMISTTTFVRLGKVYNNLMVDVMPSNLKLVARSKGIIVKATGCSKEEAEELYKKSKGNLKAAIFMYFTGCDLDKAIEYIDSEEGHLKQALNSYKKAN